MTGPWAAALFALFVWWFSTGLILWAVKRADARPEGAHLRGTLYALPVLAAGWLGFAATLDASSHAEVYGAFLSAIAIWGWFELAFLSGILTGPAMRPCPPGVPPWERFIRAWGTLAYSEMALLATLVAMGLLSRDAAHAFGFWTFAVLFFARISAKLNVYLGVPNINLEFLPRPVRDLRSHLRIAPINQLFPFSITALTLAVGCWLERAWFYPAGSAEVLGFALLTALTALALVEHWLMVLPLPDAKLWRWLVAHLDQDLTTSPKTKPY